MKGNSLEPVIPRSPNDITEQTRPPRFTVGNGVRELTRPTIYLQPALLAIIYVATPDDTLRSIVGIGILVLFFMTVLIIGALFWFKPEVLRGEPLRQFPAPTEMDVGLEVVVLKPESTVIPLVEESGVVRWGPQMKRFVGRVAKVQRIDKKEQIAWLDIDFGENEWSYAWLYWRKH